MNDKTKTRGLGLWHVSQTMGSWYLGCGVVHDLLGGQVTLVSYEQLVDVLAGIAVDLLQPLLHVVEGLLWTNPNRKFTSQKKKRPAALRC